MTVQPPAPIPELDWPGAERADAAAFEAGVLYCPVCRRPTLTTSPLEAAHRLARHLNDAHDPIFAAFLRIRLDAAARGYE